MPDSDEDYAVIEAAVMATARGRWFLAEFARRNRNADTQLLLDALARLERAVREQQTSAEALAPDLRPQQEADWAASGPVAPEATKRHPDNPLAHLTFEEKLALFS